MVDDMQDDLVFKALADPTRRLLLDALFETDGQSQSELEALAQQRGEMSRFGVAKHLRLLEEAGLIVRRKQGREQRHYLNPIPIRMIHDSWIDKYTEHHTMALLDLKRKLEES